MEGIAREIRLVARPQGFPGEDLFEVAEAPIPTPAEGQVLIRNAYFSVDPYMRPRMNDVRSYVAPFTLGEAMTGGAVGQVAVSRNARYSEGEWVLHQLGWREWALSDGATLRRLDPSQAPVSTALGVLGMPGFTAWYGLFVLGEPKEGETVLVSGAAGAVGSAAGQMARIAGCRVIGSAGSAEKVAWVRELASTTRSTIASRVRGAHSQRSLPTASTSTSTTSVAIISRLRSARSATTVASSRAVPSRATTTPSRHRGRGTCSWSSRSAYDSRATSSATTSTASASSHARRRSGYETVA